jgi:hypothetical protein
MVEITAGLKEVLVTADSRWGRHQRVWATRLTVTDPVHVETAARLRAAFVRPTPASADDLRRDLASEGIQDGSTRDQLLGRSPLQDRLAFQRRIVCVLTSSAGSTRAQRKRRRSTRLRIEHDDPTAL